MTTSTNRKSKLNYILFLQSQKIFLEFPSKKWVKLNVGGTIFITTFDSINKESGSMLARMFSQENLVPGDVDENGAYLLDRSPKYFEPLINYLRYGQLVFDPNISVQGILEEARFFGIHSLIPQLEAQTNSVVSPDAMPLTRVDVVKALIRTSYTSEIRFQGINLAGADLSKLDFRNVNFKVSKLNVFIFS